MRVDLLDPPAYSPAYDDALAAALARAGADVTLLTSAFAYGAVPAPAGYRRDERFARHAVGAPGSRLRALSKRAAHAPDLLRYRRTVNADVVHFQWSTALDMRLAPRRPTVLTVHDPHGAAGLAGADAIIVHTAYAREQLALVAPDVDPGRVHVIHHGPLGLAPAGRLPPELEARSDAPVVLCFGLIRPYKGIETLLGAWRAIEGAQLWIVGRPMYSPQVPAGVGYVPRYVTPAEQAALFAAADIVVLPYLQSERFGFSGVLATALAAAKATVVSDLGGFAEAIAAAAVRAVPAGDPDALAGALQRLIGDPDERRRLGAAAQQAAVNRFSWDSAAAQTLALYHRVSR